MGWACFSTLHRHTYQERGTSQWNKAVAETVRMVHRAMDALRSDLILTTEHPGYDYLMQFLEGCITYDTTVQACPLRPLECNLQRFYFPECKPYELDYSNTPASFAKKLWNAEGSFGSPYPVRMYVILRENEDVYQGRSFEPLVPTQARYVYANRFGSVKTLYHLYNATGHTFEGPALKVALKPGEHLFDLLSLRECRLSKEGVLRLFLPRDEVACLAKLPKRMALRASAKRLQVEVKLPKGNGRLAVCDPDGAILRSWKAKAGTNMLDLTGLPASPKPMALKLLVDGQLSDAAELPFREQSN